MPKYAPFKFVVQVGMLEFDGDNVVGEPQLEPVTLYSVSALKEWADTIESKISDLGE